MIICITLKGRWNAFPFLPLFSFSSFFYSMNYFSLSYNWNSVTQEAERYLENRAWVDLTLLNVYVLQKRWKFWDLLLSLSNISLRHWEIICSEKEGRKKELLGSEVKAIHLGIYRLEHILRKNIFMAFEIYDLLVHWK